VALWLVIDPCVNFVDVCIVIFGIHFEFLNFLRHQTMDKVQKHNSFNFLASRVTLIVCAALCKLIRGASSRTRIAVSPSVYRCINEDL
jgi:hypothetical protein